MPRPKVRWEDRRRTIRACVPCKTSKIRCDSKEPCETCIKRGRASSCVYQGPVPAAGQHDDRTTSPLERPRPFHGQATLSQPQLARTASTPFGAEYASTSMQDASTQDRESTADSIAHEGTHNKTAWVPSSRIIGSRTLTSLKGEKMFIGEMASLSFLQFLRQTVKKYIGRSSFTETNNRMLEIDTGRRNLQPSETDSADHKRALILCYYQASSAIFDLYTEEEVSVFFESNDLSTSPDDSRRNSRPPGRADDLAALYLIIAIGGQCRGLHPLDLEYAAKYFGRAQQIAFEGMLCDPSVDMIRIFLLMAFYMLGACRRNAAFMYLGVASKAAYALGLHRNDQYRNLKGEEYDVRLRTWKSLRTLDMLVSSILGRPRDSPSMRSDDEPLDDAPGKSISSRRRALNATYELCTLIDEIEQKLLTGNRIEADSAEEYLRHLRTWSQTIPEELRHFPGQQHIDVSNSADHELCVGATHVACVYYFAIILITRPFLISHLMSKLHQKTNSHVPDSGLDQQQQLQISKLSQVCLDSAIYMSNTCHNAMISGYFLNNMCMIKAWIFAAGLVLGFSLFVQGTGSTNETESAFDSAREVLKKISYLSPQARHYHEILSAFSEAIAKHQKQLVEQRRQSLNPYVSQIFTIGFDSSPSQQQQPGQQPYPSPNSGQPDDAPAVSGVEVSNGIYSDMIFPATQFEDPMTLPLLWDELSFDYNSLDPLWDGNG